MKLKSHIILSLCFLMLAGCTQMCGQSRQDMTPEQVVEAYLDISLSMKSLKEKDLLLGLTTGNLHEAIDAATDDTITKAFINKNFMLDKYSVVERKDRTPRETEITFELVYYNLGDNRQTPPDQAPKITTENTVSVLKEKGVWLIRDVLGKKTEIDFPMKDAEKITPTKPGEPTGD